MNFAEDNAQKAEILRTLVIYINEDTNLYILYFRFDGGLKKIKKLIKERVASY